MSHAEDPLAAARRATADRLGFDLADHEGRILAWEVAGTEVRLTTELTGVGRFTERLRLLDAEGGPIPVDTTDPGVRGALDLLALTTSLSYLKATLPARVVIDGPSAGPCASAMLHALLTEGLAELAFVNGLGPLDDRIRVHQTGHADAAPEPGTADPAGRARDGGVLVTVGGGKDSAVSLALAARHDPTALALAINPRAPMERTAAFAGLPLVRIERRLDDRILALNERGAINGHVPITAIVMSAAVLAARVLGRGTVLVSNESSADAPTRTVDGWRINHQFSKSSAFATLLAAALQEAGVGVQVVSLLRPLSELAIARLAATAPGLMAATTSCNAAFAVRDPSTGWCGACDKCRFVQLALAPFTTRAQVVTDLGFDALADPAQVEAFGRMLDPATKPFECVGTVEEVQLALDLLADRADWSDAAAVRAHGRAPADAAARAELAGRLEDALRPSADHHLSPPFGAWLADSWLSDPAPSR
jgi:UDP-N-acetyl-alpha-D-muramoyl-L-alanyl-L-glutamate epimerase